MVWKFSSPAAQERHAKLVSRLESTRGDVVPPQAPATPAPVIETPSPAVLSAPRRDGRVEPVLQVQEAFLESRNIRVEPVLALDATPEEAPQERMDPPEVAVGMFSQTVNREPSFDEEPSFVEVNAVAPALTSETVVLNEELPTDVFSWSVPGFEGDPDELPDLRPLPPPPMEHPGLQYRNVNTFGHALRFPAEDPRQLLWAEQRRDRGFDDTELWGLDDTFARFILPRLKALRQQKLEPPNKTMELTLWYSLLDKMIRAFELLLPEGGGAWSRGTLNDRERSQLQDGLDLFRQYFFALCL